MAKIIYDELTIQCFEGDIQNIINWDNEDRDTIAVDFADMVQVLLMICSDPHANYEADHDAAYFAVMDGTIETSSEAICWARNRYGYKD
jgi:LmbE family N-acetylglucosaminyl deacetylase